MRGNEGAEHAVGLIIGRIGRGGVDFVGFVGFRGFLIFAKFVEGNTVSGFEVEISICTFGCGQAGIGYAAGELNEANLVTRAPPRARPRWAGDASEASVAV